MIIGVLALQGDYDAHLDLLLELGVAAMRVTQTPSLEAVDGLIIPGGESTVITQLCRRYDLWEPLRRRLQLGMPALGTCAGMILLASRMTGASTHVPQPTLEALDIDLQRNAYGSQVDSFEADIECSIMGSEALRGVFIRAPRVTRVGAGVEVLARHHEAPVLVREGSVVAAAFHPEIAGERRVHEYWLALVRQGQGGGCA